MKPLSNTKLQHKIVYVKEITPAPEPLAVFKTASAGGRCYFLDSALTGEKLGRFSIIATRPLVELVARRDAITIATPAQTQRFTANPFKALENVLQGCVSSKSELPVPVGAIGYFGYDLKHFIETLPCRARRDVGLPDMYFAFCDRFFVWDHTTGKMFIVVVDLSGCEGFPQGLSPEQNMTGALRTLETVDAAGKAPDVGAEPPRVHIASNFTREEYLRAVERTIDYIYAGDIFQANLSQRFSCVNPFSPEELYLRLRKLNPAPFAAFLKFGDYAIVSSSPERFLLKESRRIQTRPIKGTRRRCPDDETFNCAMRDELLGSVKDNAELNMIIDLERNDLGRVCEYGTVRVTEKRALEEYASVYHLVATVEGILHERYSVTDLIKATFPGGSITGAPKIRAMEIIDELEPTARNLYTGSIGYLGYDGTVDLNIVIRTFLIDRGKLFFQAGGGIVADSNPEKEYQETLDKARALFQSLGVIL